MGRFKKVKCTRIKNLKFFAEVKFDAGIYWPKMIWNDEGRPEYVHEYDAPVKYANFKKEFDYDKFGIELYIANDLSEQREYEIIKYAAWQILKGYFGDTYYEDGSILKMNIELVDFEILNFDKVQCEAEEICVRR